MTPLTISRYKVDWVGFGCYALFECYVGRRRRKLIRVYTGLAMKSDAEADAKRGNEALAAWKREREGASHG